MYLCDGDAVFSMRYELNTLCFWMNLSLQIVQLVFDFYTTSVVTFMNVTAQLHAGHYFGTSWVYVTDTYRQLTFALPGCVFKF